MAEKIRLQEIEAENARLAEIELKTRLQEIEVENARLA